MELIIWHTTKYTFSEPVFLEPHVLRFQPRADGAQFPLEFALEINPQPAGVAACLDASGNTATYAWFQGLHQTLTISAHAVVRMLRENPFDYLLDRSLARLPVCYGDDDELLRPYLQRHAAGPIESDELARLTARMRDAARGELLPMLASLNNTLHARLTVIRREQGEPWSPEQTWREKCGACRDVAVLFVEVCRSLGVAARFVSGYEEPCPLAESCDLHAWAEVYIPGGGWRGYDPSRGLAVTQHHVAIAAAASAASAAPVSGAFRGTGIISQMECDIRLEQRSHAVSG